MMRLRQFYRSRTYRRVELSMLGIIFLSLLWFLYCVLTTDQITVLSWFGIRVHNQPISNRLHITSSRMSQKRQPYHEVKSKGRALNASVAEGLFLDDFKIHRAEGDIYNERHYIAIGCAITSRGIKISAFDNIETAVTFLRTFFPSFCKSKPSNKHVYRIYLAYDRDDAFFMEQKTQETFVIKMNEIKNLLCPEKIDVKVKFHECPYSGRPAWSQNDVMFDAYLDDMDFFYRVNDDTSLTSQNWTEIMINALKSNHPPNVGVVGPAHKGGNDAILVHDFVHKSHVDIFGFYYPRTFPDWWADDWISAVYGTERTGKLETVKAIHTGEKGTRYNHSWIPPTVLGSRVTQDRATLVRYLTLFLKNSLDRRCTLWRRVFTD